MGMYLDVATINDNDAHKATDVNLMDVGKHVLDKEFVSWTYKVDMDYVSCMQPYCCCMSYWRPKDLDMAIKWVRRKKDGRKHALINVMEIMKNDPKLYFYYC